MLNVNKKRLISYSWWEIITNMVAVLLQCKSSNSASSDGTGRNLWGTRILMDISWPTHLKWLPMVPTFTSAHFVHKQSNEVSCGGGMFIHPAAGLVFTAPQNIATCRTLWRHAAVQKAELSAEVMIRLLGEGWRPPGWCWSKQTTIMAMMMMPQQQGQAVCFCLSVCL